MQTTAQLAYPINRLAITPGRDSHVAPAREAHTAPPGGRVPVRRLDSSVLLAGSAEIEIEHGESIYRLRLTSMGKLILTK